MFARTLKANHKKKKTQTIIENHLSKSQTKTNTIYPFQTNRQFQKLYNKSYLHFTTQQPLICLKSPSKDQRLKIATFQNDYLKKIAFRQAKIDERKNLIKEKIKGKVKQQLSDLIKRSDISFNTQIQPQKKDQNINKKVFQVQIKGSSVKKNNRSSAFHRLQSVRFEKNKNLKKSSVSPLKQSSSIERINLRDSIPNSKHKNRRSLSSFIKINNVSPSKSGRDVHSSLGGMYMSQNRQSLQIQPWNYVEEW